MENKCSGCGESDRKLLTAFVDVNGIRCGIHLETGELAFMLKDIPKSEYGHKHGLTFEKIKDLSHKEKVFLLEEAIHLREQEIRKRVLDLYEEIGSDIGFNGVQK